MTTHPFSLRRVLAALIVCGATGSAQLTTVPHDGAHRDGRGDSDARARDACLRLVQSLMHLDAHRSDV